MSGFSAIGLYHTKTDANMGGVMRAAECFDVKLIMLVGRRFQKEPTDVYKTYRKIPVLEVERFDATPYDCQKVVIEVREDAVSLQEFAHPSRAFYIFGPEDGSVPDDIVAGCQHRVCIPTKHCLNLAATANIVLYDRMAKRGQVHQIHKHSVGKRKVIGA
jgi:tRNA(Leu) C34 or U34 (ribose-2'-O)-methylase TrmL